MKKLFNITNFKIIVLFIAFTILTGESAMDIETADFIDILPATLNGWKISDKDHIYNRETLYDYINGGAELYLSYGFNNVLNRVYERKDQPDIIIDIFDMKSSQNAFGVFSHSMELVDSTIGQGSQYTSGMLLFWKNRFYISVLASPETQESKKTVWEIARLIDRHIPETGNLPAILNLLPEDGLRKETIRFFRHHVWLNSYYFISEGNILNINKNTDAVLSRYRYDNGEAILVLVEYPNHPALQAAYDSFIEKYLPDISPVGAVKIEDNSWTAVSTNDRVLITVFNASRKDISQRLIQQVKANRQN